MARQGRDIQLMLASHCNDLQLISMSAMHTTVRYSEAEALDATATYIAAVSA